MVAQAHTDPTTALLVQLAREADTLAAHHAEFVPDGHSADAETFAALQAAVSFGCAIGLRRAAELIEQSTLVADRDGRQG